MRDVVVLFAGRAKSRGNDLPGGHLEVGDQALGAMADVFKFDPFDLAGAHRFDGVFVFERLDAGLFIGTGDVDAMGVQGGGVLIQLTDGGGVRGKLLRVEVRVEPIPHLMRLKVGLLLKTPHVAWGNRLDNALALEFVGQLPWGPMRPFPSDVHWLGAREGDELGNLLRRKSGRTSAPRGIGQEREERLAEGRGALVFSFGGRKSALCVEPAAAPCAYGLKIGATGLADRLIARVTGTRQENTGAQHETMLTGWRPD